MALRVPAPKAAEIAIGSIGRGYDISIDLRLKYCKGESTNSRLIEVDEDEGREIVLPGGITIANVSKSIKCDKGERTRFRSDVLSFQQVLFLSFVQISGRLYTLIVVLRTSETNLSCNLRAFFIMHANFERCL